MKEKVECIVLRIQDYKENDVLLHAISKQRGFLSIVARSSKIITSKHRFFEGCKYEFIIDFKDGKTIYTSLSCKTLEMHYDLQNTSLLCFKNIFYDLYLKSKDMYDFEMYENLNTYLNVIDDNNKYLLGSLLGSYLSIIHGVNPNVDECVVCKCKNVVAISNSLGGFICADHSGSSVIRDVETLRKFRLINKAKFSNLNKILDIKYSYQDFKLIIDFLLYNTGFTCKPYDFYKSII